jgi:CRISPR-associated protein Cas5t
MEIIETFPLPAPSTIIGFFHALLGLNELSQKLDVSIQGDYGAVYRDYQLYVKGTNGLSSFPWQQIQNFKIKKEPTKPYPIVVNAMHNVHLIIHVNGSEGILKRLYDLLINPPFYPHLGRAEDLVKIKSVKMVNVSEIKRDWFPIPSPAYIRSDRSTDFGLKGILFSLPTYFKFKQVLQPVTSKRKSKKQTTYKLVRDFLWQDYIYVEPDFIEVDDGVNIVIDEENCPVWWLMPQPHPLERNW